MFPSRFLLIIVFVLDASNAFAQEADTTNYFPLDIDNSWTYYTELDPPDSPPIITVGNPLMISDTVTVNDTLYYVAPHPNSFADTLRSDGRGKIWARYQDRDVLLYDFTLAEGDKYYFDRSEADWDTFEVVIERNVTIEVVAGHFENCIRLYFDIPEGADFGHTYVFAPNVGIVTSYDGMGEGSFLYEALIEGKVISSTEDENPTSRRENGAYAYPNPFTFATTVILPTKIVPAPTALVYDVLGRRVASLTAGRCEPGRCEYRWNAGNWPPGLYYVVIEGGASEGVARLVLGS